MMVLTENVIFLYINYPTANEVDGILILFAHEGKNLLRTSFILNVFLLLD
jgi:hypothetical protein